MKIKKDELYYFLANKLGMSSYVGIHGTAIRGDIENEYMNMTKEEKAQNIMKLGLINRRSNNLTLTCDFFGILPLLMESAEKRKSITKLNNMSYINGFDKGEQGQVMVIVAIPVEFIKADHSSYFCGWIDIKQSSSGQYSKPYCLSDYLFQNHIPPEFIYGYYTYQNLEDSDVEIHFNRNHYSNLTPEEKDLFIKENIEETQLFKIFREIQESSPYDSLVDPNLASFYSKRIQNNPIEQFEIYSKLPKLNPKTSSEKEVYYTQEELESMPLLDIDLTKVKPSYEDIINGKYNVKYSIINESIFGIQLPHEVGLLLDKKHFSITEFEQAVRECGNTPENLYKYWYTTNKLDFDRLYKEYIKELQDLEISKIRNTNFPTSPNDSER